MYNNLSDWNRISQKNASLLITKMLTNQHKNATISRNVDLSTSKKELMSMEERFGTFTMLISKISRSIKRIKSEEMAEFQLKGSHVSCLYYLSVYGSMTAAELCERCEEDKAAISRSLDYLEKNGFVTYGENTRRRYRVALQLTEKGKEVCNRIGAKINRIVDEASEGLTEEDRKAMYHTLQLISRNLEKLD